MCRCCEPKFVGCVGTCSSLTIADAPETGVYRMELEFNGTAVNIESALVANVGDPIVFNDLKTLNENYKFCGQIIAPSGTAVLPADYDCICFRTQIGGGDLTITL